MMENNVLGREYCHRVIEKCIDSDKFEIVHFKVKAFEDKDNDYYKSDSVLEISAKISKNVSRFRFFLKKLYSKHPVLNEYLTSIKAYERELTLYEQFLPALCGSLKDYEADYAPKFLLGVPDEMLILEDLSLLGYVKAKKINPLLLDRFHISLALKKIAKLHAGSLSYQKLHGRKAFEDFSGHGHLFMAENEELLTSKALRSGIKGIKTLLTQLQQLESLDDSLASKIDSLVQRCLEISKPQATFRNVVCHGDLHTKNMLFKYEEGLPTDCVFVNFGLCLYFPPAYDVLSLIFSTTNRLFRQHYFTYLIEYYHDCLHNELSAQGLHVDEILPFEELRQSVNYLMPLIKLRSVLFLQEHGAKDGFYKILQKDQAAYRHFLFEDKSEFLLDVIRRDSVFKMWIVEALEEFLETLNSTSISKENCYEILEKRLKTTAYDLNEFYANATNDDENILEVSMSVRTDDKDDVTNLYKYLMKNNKYSVEILGEIQ